MEYQGICTCNTEASYRQQSTNTTQHVPPTPHFSDFRNNFTDKFTFPDHVTYIHSSLKDLTMHYCIITFKFYVLSTFAEQCRYVAKYFINAIE